MTNETAICPSPLVSYDRLVDTTIIAFDNCAVPCPTLEFTGQQWGTINKIVEILVFISFFASFTVLVGHLGDFRKFYIRKMFIGGFMANSFVLSIFMLSNSNDSVICNGKAHYVKHGWLCMLQAAATIFSFLWTVVWSTILAYDTYCHVTSQFSTKGTNKRHYQYTIVAIIVSVSFTAIPFFAGNLGFDTKADIPFCMYLFSENSMYYWLLFFIPTYGLVFATLVITIVTGFKLHKIFVTSRAYYNMSRASDQYNPTAATQPTRPSPAAGTGGGGDGGGGNIYPSSPAHARQLDTSACESNNHTQNIIKGHNYQLCSEEDAADDNQAQEVSVQSKYSITDATHAHAVAQEYQAFIHRKSVTGRYRDCLESTDVDNDDTSDDHCDADFNNDDDDNDDDVESRSKSHESSSVPKNRWDTIYSTTSNVIDKERAASRDDKAWLMSHHHHQQHQQQLNSNSSHGHHHDNNNTTRNDSDCIYDRPSLCESIRVSDLSEKEREGEMGEDVNRISDFSFDECAPHVNSTSAISHVSPNTARSSPGLGNEYYGGGLISDSNGGSSVSYKQWVAAVVAAGEGQGRASNQSRQDPSHSNPRNPRNRGWTDESATASIMQTLHDIWKFNGRSIVFVVVYCLTTLAVAPLLLHSYLLSYGLYLRSRDDFIACLESASKNCEVQTQFGVNACARVCGEQPAVHPDFAIAITQLVWAAAFGIFPSIIFGGCSDFKACVKHYWRIATGSSSHNRDQEQGGSTPLLRDSRDKLTSSQS